MSSEFVKKSKNFFKGNECPKPMISGGSLLRSFHAANLEAQLFGLKPSPPASLRNDCRFYLREGTPLPLLVLPNQINVDALAALRLREHQGIGRLGGRRELLSSSGLADVLVSREGNGRLLVHQADTLIIQSLRALRGVKRLSTTGIIVRA